MTVSLFFFLGEFGDLRLNNRKERGSRNKVISRYTPAQSPRVASNWQQPRLAPRAKSRVQTIGQVDWCRGIVKAKSYVIETSQATTKMNGAGLSSHMDGWNLGNETDDLGTLALSWFE